MTGRVSDSIKGMLQTFFGGAAFSLVYGDPCLGPAGGAGNLLIERIAAKAGDYYIAFQRNCIPFTEMEKRIAHEIADALRIVFSTSHMDHESVFCRATLLASLMDNAICRYLTFDRHRAFFPVQKLLHILKILSYQMYEGTPATSGFIVYLKQPGKFRTACSISDCLMYDFSPRIGVTADFFKNPLTYRLVNGLGALYTCNLNLRAGGMIKFMNYWNRDAVERLSNRDVFSLINRTGYGAFSVNVTAASELEILTCPDKILVWRTGNWSLFDPDIFRCFLEGHLDGKEMESLILAVYTLSKSRLGTIILISGENVLTSSDLKKGAVGGKDLLSRLIVGIHKGKSISDLKHSGDLINLLSSDGMTLFNGEGKLIDAGIIINTCVIPDLVTGGGRTTAATAASMFGKVIKVSEDGPIELYERGRCVYRFG